VSLLPSPNVAVRRFRVVQMLSLAVKLAVLFVAAYLLLRYSGGM
jgi:hypothetical protein